MFAGNILRMYVWVRVCVWERVECGDNGKGALFNGNVDDVILVITTSAKETNRSVTDYGLTVLVWGWSLSFDVNKENVAEYKNLLCIIIWIVQKM